ncbi:hypothetical protein MLD38_035551 [Melastoma candidum]|uniref:Uncharacterized protein n=1 Tax=Melastoma candidum TaxID=119954 RepID=A0ACB9LHC2_9MYRT|nr:hypothetical protein MLD38_035551 [Melastoma candidum]
MSISSNNNGLSHCGYRPGNGGVLLEPMFEKQLTPSDVGKLNRLVIPKQQAERFFPLSSSPSSYADGSSLLPYHNSSSDRADGMNGMLLGFEDEAGKSWRFRYSYWSSSQSYVLTKGWSRYVKEKGLESGDVVFFARLGPPGAVNGGGERFFIGWRRRRAGAEEACQGPVSAASRGWSGRAHDMMQTYPDQHGHGPILPYRDQNHNYIHPGDVVHVDPNLNHGYSQTTSSSRKLRLFGVNLECCLPDVDDVSDDVS